MAKWSVAGDNRRLVIETTADGRIALDIVPPGEPFTVDADTAQDIRLKIGAAISVALGGGA